MNYSNDEVNNSFRSSPLISVIIAVFNGSGTLQKCLDSVASQTYLEKEVIVIDGGSSDGTVDLLRDNGSTITYWESEPDKGIAHAWNKGLKKSNGEWIIFIGADDRLHDASVLSDMAITLCDDLESDLVYGQILFGDGRFENIILGDSFDWAIYRRRMLIPHTGCFQRKSLFKELGDFDESYKVAMDYEIFLRKPGLKAKFIRRLVTVMGGEGMSTKLGKYSLLEGRRAQLKHGVDMRIKVEVWHLIYQFRNMLEL